MNHQEIFKLNFGLTKLPNPFSAWPYFILIVATFLMGTTKLSSQSMHPESSNGFKYESEMESLWKNFSNDSDVLNYCKQIPIFKEQPLSTDVHRYLMCPVK